MLTFVATYSDDKVEEAQLATAFDLTCRAWQVCRLVLPISPSPDSLPQSHFNVPYMHCGCPLPGQTIGQKLAKLVSQHLAPRTPPSSLAPPANKDLLAGTHPSDHNAVFTFHHKATSDAARKKRTAKVAARQVRDMNRAKKAGVQDATHVDRHPFPAETAFLIPIPVYFYGQGLGEGCVSYGGAVNGGCAAVSSFPLPRVRSLY